MLLIDTDNSRCVTRDLIQLLCDSVIAFDFQITSRADTTSLRAIDRRHVLFACISRLQGVA